MSTIEIRLPRGRIVSGHPMKLRDSTDPQTKQVKVNDRGEVKQECFFQVAIPKTEPALYGAEGVFAQMAKAAGRAWPANPATDQFAWKVDDGDSPRLDRQTGQYVPRADYCRNMWLFNVKSHGWVPKVHFQPAPGQPHQEMLDASMIKTGDYVDVGIKVEPNGAFGLQAGLYMNPSFVRFNEAGGAISTGGGASASDMDRMFAGQPAHAPMAAPQQAPAPAPMGAPTYPQPGMNPAPTPPVQGGMPAPAPVGAPVPPIAYPTNPVYPTNVQPAPDFVNGPVAPVAPVYPTAPGQGQGPTQ